MLTALAGSAVPLRPGSLVLLLAARREQRLRETYAMQLLWLIAAELSGGEEFTFPDALSLFPLPEDPRAPRGTEDVRRRILRQLNHFTRKE